MLIVIADIRYKKATSFFFEYVNDKNSSFNVFTLVSPPALSLSLSLSPFPSIYPTSVTISREVTFFFRMLCRLK